MATGLWIGLAAGAGALATVLAGRKAREMGVLFDEEETMDVAAGAPGPAGGGGGGLGPVAGMPGPAGGGGGPSLGPVVAQGTPMPPSPGGPSGGFPGTFPTMGPASTVFGFSRPNFFFGDEFGSVWPLYPPYSYPPAPAPTYVCRWQETPPKEDTPMVCTPQYVQPRYPVTYGPPNWGWW